MSSKLEKLRQIVAELRGENGCPWDKAQTHASLAAFAIEEAFELAEAIEIGNDEDLKSELGDVLFQVVLHSQIASETKRFDLDDVIQVLSDKMIRRHPHVFSDVRVSGAEDVMKNWEKIKAQEKASKGRSLSKEYLDAPKGLPALMEAKKIGSKTKKVGFDWSEPEQVLEKVKEELRELEEVMEERTKKADLESLREKITLEIGDCLFSLAQLARHLDIDPEQALRRTNQKFRRRFRSMIETVDGKLDDFAALPAEQKEKLWNEAKKAEKT